MLTEVHSSRYRYFTKIKEIPEEKNKWTGARDKDMQAKLGECQQPKLEQLKPQTSNVSTELQPETERTFTRVSADEYMGSINKMNKQKKTDEITIHLRGWRLTQTLCPTEGRLRLTICFSSVERGKRRLLRGETQQTPTPPAIRATPPVSHADSAHQTQVMRKAAHTSNPALTQSREALETNPD